MEKLKFITCSGVNENISDVGELFVLSQKYPQIEFGVQVSGRKCSFNSERFKWIRDILRYSLVNCLPINMSLHINQDWVEGLCQGQIVDELLELLNMRTFNKKLLFKRVQLNFRIGREKDPNFDKLYKILSDYSTFERRFILSYNDFNVQIIKELYKEGVHFDCLYDTSFGEGITPVSRNAPAFADFDILQGYAGGISPDNVKDELKKIAEVVPTERAFFIDAEGKLKNSNGIVSLKKCEQYVINALEWQKSL